MYGKIFASMYDGTLRADWKALVTFQQFIVLADSQGVVDMTPHAIHGRTGIPLDIIEHGIQALADPDPYSRSEELEGRRIVLLDESRPWGWRIVNYAYYRNLGSIADKREKDRVRINKKRRKVSRPVADSRDPSQTVADVAHTNTEANTEVKEKRGARKRRATPLPDGFALSAELTAWTEAKGLDPKTVASEFERFCNWHRAKGSTFVDWNAAWRTWVGKHLEFRQARAPDRNVSIEGAI